ncbi:MAG: ABC transporter ATP-binding protein [Ruminococcaceae bacterium]|nr:ABC transporter ATP-binding protein [Oscillospiraceae bacterium]
MIEVRNLTKTYGDNTVVDHLNFTIEPGKIYGFLGPNGAGKSTTMNMITGCLAPTEGQVLIDGHDVLTDAVAAKREIGYLPEIPPLYPDMTPEEYLRFVAEAKGLRGEALWDQVYRVMEETDILDMRNRLIKNLSKGYKQRVGIAQAMLGEPKLIILDEPTVGLDPRQITEIRELILRLGQTRTIVLSSHILAEVSAVCEQVMIINRGRLVASDTLENIRRDNTPENRVEMTVRADADAVKAVLTGMAEVLSFTSAESVDEPGLRDVSIDVLEGADIREALFFAFAEKGYAVRRLAKAELSLEEIFLQLTDSGYREDDGSTYASYGRDDEDEYEYEEDDEDADEEDEAYVPLFGGSREEDDDEEDEE